MRFQLLIYLLSITSIIFAQQKTGLVLDNYAGTNATQYNAANLADSRFQFHMNIVGFNANLQNNYIQFETPKPIRRYALWSLDSNFLKENPNNFFEETFAVERLNGSKKKVFAHVQVDYLNMQFGLDDRSGVAIHFSTKGYAHLAGMPEDVVKTFLQDLGDVGEVKAHQHRLMGQNMDASNGGAGALLYHQIGAKYALVVDEGRKHLFKIGFGLDYNLGFFGAYGKFNDAKYTLTGVDTIDIQTSDLEFAYMMPAYYEDNSRRFNDFLGKSKLGNGVGINGGFVYEKRANSKEYKYRMNKRTLEDRSVNKYKWKVGASINDLGYVNFNKPNVARKIVVPTPTSNLSWNDFDEVDFWVGPEDADTFSTNFFTGVDTSSQFRMFTPASLNTHFDYMWFDGFYTGAVYNQSLMRNKTAGVKTATTLSIIPRYETKWITASLPLSVGSYYNKINVGAYVRAGIFYIGSDNLGSLVGQRETNGANLYAGFNWPIHYKRLKDGDGDEVSDDIDECPNIKGTYRTKGCPDRDGDKVVDSEDRCPDTPGSKRTYGCPDNDNDGLVGEDDLCPDKYGDKSSAGCPDSDGDGVHDGIDECVEEAGEKILNGCPERIVIKDVPIIDPPVDTIPIHIEYGKDTNFIDFNRWDFKAYEYWPVLGAYNDIRWAEELKTRLQSKLGINVDIRQIPGISKHYVTLGKATTLEEAKRIQATIDIGSVNNELNGEIWWKKVFK